jgi:hypothetical protein
MPKIVGDFSESNYSFVALLFAPQMVDIKIPGQFGTCDTSYNHMVYVPS